MMKDAAPLAPGAIEKTLKTEYVTPATQSAIRKRLAWTPPTAPKCFGADMFLTLRAICDRLIPQIESERRVELAARLDEAIADGPGHGWRYDVLPPTRTALPQGIAGIDETAQAMFDKPFRNLPPEDQDNVLSAVQRGSPPGETWNTLDAKRLFEELFAALTELYYGHPYAQEKIGYIGMADAQGFHALGLNARDPIEDEASVAPL